VRQGGIQPTAWTHHKDKSSGGLRDSIDSLTRKIASKPDLQTSILEDVALVTGYVNKVEHGLGTTPRGCRCESSSEFVLFEVVSLDSLYCNIAVTADCTVNLVVY
jgi:hypothetical protein